MLGHAVVSATCITCRDLLAAIHGFYEQRVLLQAPTAAAGAQTAAQQQQHSSTAVRPASIVVRRRQLLGTQLMLQGLLRVSKAGPVYEVILSAV